MTTLLGTLLYAIPGIGIAVVVAYVLARLAKKPWPPDD
jgi:hypothetical protein